jgi:hypothetical protein
VCGRSSAAPISSRMYIGDGLNCSSAVISYSSMGDLYTSTWDHVGLRHVGVMKRMRWIQLAAAKFS